MNDPERNIYSCSNRDIDGTSVKGTKVPFPRSTSFTKYPIVLIRTINQLRIFVAISQHFLIDRNEVFDPQILILSIVLKVPVDLLAFTFRHFHLVDGAVWISFMPIPWIIRIRTLFEVSGAFVPRI